MHHWYFLDRAVPAEQGKEIGKAIKAASGADANTGVVTQPYRVAGTPNFPNAAKRDKGRVIAPTRIIEHSGKLYTPAELLEAFKPAPKSDKPEPESDASVRTAGGFDSLPPALREAVTADVPEGERSEKFHAVVGRLMDLKWSFNSVVALFEEYPNGIASKGAGRIREYTRLSWDKLDKDRKTQLVSIPEEDRPCFMVFDKWTRIAEHDKPLAPGVWLFEAGKSGKGENAVVCLTQRYVCGPLHVDAITSSISHDNFGRLLRFQNTNKNWRIWPMPMEVLKGDDKELRGPLLDMGLDIDHDNRAQLPRYIGRQRPKKMITSVRQVGWHNGSFVLPDEVIGPLKDSVIFQSGEHAQVGYDCGGTLAGWQTEIAALAIRNPLLMFSISCAFTGPLLSKCHAEGGGIHFRSASSQGKTTLLRSAVSAWGSRHHMRTWSATAAGMEGIASRYNDNMLPLDEINECPPKEIGLIVYSLANGVGKQRANRIGSARATAEWRCFVLSSGEHSLATVMLDAGIIANAGQDVRLLEVPVKRNLGAWDFLHGMADGGAFSDALKSSSEKHYGHAGRAFLEKLTRDNRDWPAMFRVYKERNDFRPPSKAGQDQRAAGRFALVAMAGEIAAEYGVVPWKPGESAKAAAEMFKTWQSERKDGNREPHKIREMVADFIDKHGASRFEPYRYAGSRVVINNRAGWWEENSHDESRTYYFLKYALIEASKGFDFERVLDAMQECGAWNRPKGNNPSLVKKIPGVGAQRVFPIHAAKLSGI